MPPSMRLRRALSLPLELIAMPLVGLACAGTGGAGGGVPVVVAVVEVTDAAPITSGAVAAPSMGGAGGDSGGCAYETEVKEIAPSSPTCTIYEQVSRGGRVVVPCNGADGPARATFGDHEYRGEVKAKRVLLEHSFDFEEKDGCRWRVKGRLQGTLPSGGGEGRLAWSYREEIPYREEILEDDTTNCWATCTAHTVVVVSPVH
jgi:hypothetical protein